VLDWRVETVGGAGQESWTTDKRVVRCRFMGLFGWCFKSRQKKVLLYGCPKLNELELKKLNELGMLWKLASCENYENFNQVHRILIRWPQLKVGCASSEIIGLESWWEGLSE
jgi:hypothetical protein